MTNPTTLAVKLGQSLRRQRQATGLSQDNFAAIERGEKNITLATLQRVARGYGVSMSSLLRDLD
jgi:transcriptional regulator with XRE-family HTH domain